MHRLSTYLLPGMRRCFGTRIPPCPALGPSLSEQPLGESGTKTSTLLPLTPPPSSPCARPSIARAAGLRSSPPSCRPGGTRGRRDAASCHIHQALTASSPAHQARRGRQCLPRPGKRRPAGAPARGGGGRGGGTAAEAGGNGGGQAGARRSVQGGR